MPDLAADAPADVPPAPGPSWSRRRARVSAALEVILCSGFPTQIALGVVLAVAGLAPTDGQLSLRYVSTLLLIDAVVVIALVVWLLRLHGEPVGAVLLGHGAIGRELLAGLPLSVAALGLMVAIAALIQTLAPWLHNVPTNPFENLIRTGRDAAIFVGVAGFAGGVREEISRAFVLRRFERHLGGAWVGLAVFSAAFGAGHIVQGWDAVIITGTLGAFWGAVYLTRGSVVAPVVSHVGFNTTEIIRFAVWGT
jgi:membrane protease YdiL (CAAX protease family)